jgi:hypothetical protein
MSDGIAAHCQFVIISFLCSDFVVLLVYIVALLMQLFVALDGSLGI